MNYPGSGANLSAPHEQAADTLRIIGWCGTAGAMVFLYLSSQAAEFLRFFAVLLVFTSAAFLSARSIRNAQVSGRWLGVAIALLTMLAFPFGTFAGFHVVVILLSDWPKPKNTDGKLSNPRERQDA